MRTMDSIQREIMDIILDPRRSNRQIAFALAEYAENLCDYPSGAPVEAFRRLEAQGILCDHNDGHAPYAPRYLLPDYGVLMEKGCAYLNLPPPADLSEALASLIMLYINVPSVTHFPVYAGHLDRLLEPFLDGIDPHEARKRIRLFLLQMDRMICDSFCHVNIGPEPTRAGEILVETCAELQNAVPNMTLLYEPDVTTDSFAAMCVRAALRCANPAFAADAYFRERVGEAYGIASCYNGLLVGGGAYSLSRMRLGKAAEAAADEADFFRRVLPEAVDVACEFMEAKVRFLAEAAPFFQTNFLVTEGFLHRDRFTGLFGLVGLNECVNVLMERRGLADRYGHTAAANELGIEIIRRIEERVNAFCSDYCACTNHRFVLHAQVGACGDNGVTPGVRIAIGSEPPLYEHIRQAGLFHPFFPSGIGDIFPFDQTADRNPEAVLDIFKAAFRQGMHYISAYASTSDVIRVTGYLIKRSDMERYLGGHAVANGAVGASEETILHRGTYRRKVRGV